MMNTYNLQSKIKHFFHFSVENEEQIIQEISEGVSFRGATV